LLRAAVAAMAPLRLLADEGMAAAL